MSPQKGVQQCPRWPHTAGILTLFFWVLKGKVRTGTSEQGRTLPSNTKTRIGQTLGIVLGTLTHSNRGG
jgi:hypothetical protein